MPRMRCVRQIRWSGEAGDVLPDDDFDYEKFVAEEFRSHSVKPHGLHWRWWVAAVVLLLAFVLLLLVR